MSTNHPIIGGHASGSQDGRHGRATRVAIICACLIGAALTVALLAAVARGIVASPSLTTTISHVCVSKSGQLFYFDSCKRRQTETDVSSSSTDQFKACYLLSTGVTRKVSNSTNCNENPRNLRKKEGTLEKVPDNTDPLYFCVGTDGTMYFERKGTPEPTCPAGQSLVVIDPHDAAPSVSSTLPVKDATNIAVNRNIDITFTEAVTASTNAFTLVCGGDSKAFDLSGSGTSTITLDPTADLPEGTNCTVTAIAANISDTDTLDPPDHPASNTSFTFTTDSAPTVTSTTPDDDATNVDPSGNIEVDFSEPVNANGSSFTLECPSGTSESFSVSGSGTSTITLDPDSNLPGTTECTVTVVASEISDTDSGDPPDNLAANHNFSFTTDSHPSVLSTTPDDAADHASFQIDGDTLKTSETFDFETKSSYTVLVKSTDSGGLSFEKQFTISINDVNDAPTDIALTKTSIDENQPSGTTIGTLTATDPDSGQTHTFTLEDSGCGGGTFDNGSFSISGGELKSATSFDFETKPSYTICVRATDNGTPTNLSFDKQFTITINDANDPPVVTTSGGISTFTEDGPPVAVDGGLTVADPDSANMASATVQITGNYASSEDQLHFTDTAEIKGSYDAPTGKLTLTGTATKAQYEAALRSVTYSNTSQNPSNSPRTVTFVVNDGSATNNLSNAATKTVNVTPVNDAPALTQPDGNLSYTEDTPTENHEDAIAPNLTVADVDSTTIKSATVQITGNYQNGQDILSFTAANGISGTFDAASGTLTLTHASGTKTLADYQAALRSVKYSNTSEDPSSLERTVAFQADDGGSQNNLSNAATRKITVTPTNDNPVAVADSFTSTATSALANTTMTVGTTVSEPHTSSSGNPLSNDTDVDSPTSGFTATPVTNASTTRGGRVTINSDGTFTYRPPPGITTNGGSSPDDTFTYTLHDNGSPDRTATGTVSVRIVGPISWYVDDSAAAGGNGTSGSPFQSLGPLSTGGGSDSLDGTGDRIFVYSGNYTQGIALEDNQKLLGEPQGLSFTDNNGRNQSLVAAGGSSPAISSSSGPVVGLASGNELQDLSLGNAGSGAASLSGTSVGTATAADSTINNTSGKAIDIGTTSGPGTLAMTLGSVSSAGSGSEGIKLTNVGGNLTINGGSLTNATNADVAISQGSPNFSYAGSITDDLGTLVSIANTTGGTKSFTGAISDGNDGDGSGVSLTGNTGGTTSFGGGLVLSTGANPAFTATGGGTVNVTGSNNTLATTTGTAMNVANTTIGANGLNFKSIAANGAPNGIVLNNTGSSGGLTVTGTGTTGGSGGTIQGVTNRGVSAIGTSSLTLKNMTFTNDGTTNGADPTVATSTCGDLLTGSNTGCNAAIHLDGVTGATLDNLSVSGGNQIGINGNNVTALALTNSTIQNAGDQTREDGIRFRDLKGTSSMSNVTAQGNEDNQLRIANGTGATGTLNISGSTFQNSTNPNGEYGFQLDTIGSGGFTTTIGTSTFNNTRGGGLVATAQGSSSLNVTASGGTWHGNFGAVSNFDSAIQVVGADSSNVKFNVHDITNPMLGYGLNVIHLQTNSPGTVSLQGQVVNTTIGDSTSAASASTTGAGIGFNEQSQANSKVRFSNNTIKGVSTFGITMQMGNLTTANTSVDAIVQNNTISVTPTATALQGIFVNSGTTSANPPTGRPADAGTFCAQIGGSGAGNVASSVNADGLRVRQRFGTTVRLPGYGGGAADTSAVNSFLAANNPALGDTISSTTQAPGSFAGGGDCSAPTLP